MFCTSCSSVDLSLRFIYLPITVVVKGRLEIYVRTIRATVHSSLTALVSPLSCQVTDAVADNVDEFCVSACMKSSHFLETWIDFASTSQCSQPLLMSWKTHQSHQSAPAHLRCHHQTWLHQGLWATLKRWRTSSATSPTLPRLSQTCPALPRLSQHYPWSMARNSQSLMLRRRTCPLSPSNMLRNSQSLKPS